LIDAQSFSGKVTRSDKFCRENLNPEAPTSLNIKGYRLIAIASKPQERRVIREVLSISLLCIKTEQDQSLQNRLGLINRQ